MANFSELNHKLQHNAALAYVESKESESLFDDVDEVNPEFVAEIRAFTLNKKKLKDRLELAEGKPMESVTVERIHQR